MVIVNLTDRQHRNIVWKMANNLWILMYQELTKHSGYDIVKVEYK